MDHSITADFSCRLTSLLTGQDNDKTITGRCSDQIEFLQCELQDGILDSSEHESDVFCVSGAGEMRVNDFIGVWIQVDKHLQDEFSCSLSVPLGSLERKID